MRARKIRQNELFDADPLAATPTLQQEVTQEVLQLLTQWLHALTEAMVRGSRDEQDRR